MFTVGLAPPDDAAARTLVGTAVDSLDPAGISATDALDRVSDAVADALADGPLERDDFHQALRERLPNELLVVPWLPEPSRAPVAVAGDRHPWCARGRRAARAGDSVRRAAEAARRQRPPSWRGASCTPTAPPRGDLAALAGIAPAHARALLDAIAGEVDEVEFDSRRR